MRFPFITPGVSKKTIIGGLVLKKILQQNSFLNQNWTVGGPHASKDVSANHTGQTETTSAGTTEGTITDTPDNKVKLFIHDTLAPPEDGSGREIYGRLTKAGLVWTITFYTWQGGADVATNLPADTYDYWYVVRTNLKDVDEGFAISDVKELPIDVDKYAPDVIVAQDGTGHYITLAAGVAACPSGGTLWIKAGDYSGEGAIAITQPIIILALSTDGSVIIDELDISDSDVRIFGGVIDKIEFGVAFISRFWLLYSETDSIYAVTGGGGCVLSYCLFYDNIISTFGTATDKLSIQQSDLRCKEIQKLELDALTCSSIIGTAMEEVIIDDVQMAKIDNNIFKFAVNNDLLTIDTITESSISNNIIANAWGAGYKFINITSSIDHISIVGNIMNVGASSLDIYINPAGSATGWSIISNNVCRQITIPDTESIYCVDNITATGGKTRNPFPLLSADPATLVAGMCWYNTTDSQFKGYNGAAVVILG